MVRCEKRSVLYHRERKKSKCFFLSSAFINFYLWPASSLLSVDYVAAIQVYISVLIMEHHRFPFIALLCAEWYNMVPTTLSDVYLIISNIECITIKHSSGICSVQTTTPAHKLQLQFDTNNPTILGVPAEIWNPTYVFIETNGCCQRNVLPTLTPGVFGNSHCGRCWRVWSLSVCTHAQTNRGSQLFCLL